MRLENAVAADVLERILSAYGFTMQKELSDKLGIAKSNVASWLQRGQVPGNVLVQCALDTGADVQWLVTGTFANANNFAIQQSPIRTSINGQSLINKMLKSGGKPVLQRIMDAYGFRTQKELSEYLGISTGTISTWIRREYFPGDVVIACALDTNFSLDWLATGEYSLTPKEVDIEHISNNFIKIPRMLLKAGALEKIGFWNADLKFIPKGLTRPILIDSKNNSWLVDFGVISISNGVWALSIADRLDIYEVNILTNSRVYLKNSISSFECEIGEVISKGHVIAKYERYD